MLNEKPAAKHWWSNITNAVRSVFQDAAKKNGVDTEKLKGLGAEDYVKGVAEQMALGKMLNEWTAYGKDKAYFAKGVEIGDGDSMRDSRAQNIYHISAVSEYGHHEVDVVASSPEFAKMKFRNSMEKKYGRGFRADISAIIKPNDTARNRQAGEETTPGMRDTVHASYAQTRLEGQGDKRSVQGVEHAKRGVGNREAVKRPDSNDEGSGRTFDDALYEEIVSGEEDPHKVEDRLRRQIRFSRSNTFATEDEGSYTDAAKRVSELKKDDYEYGESVRNGMADPPDIRYSRIVDKDEIKRLNDGRKIRMLASVQDMDGMLRSPMAAKIGGKMADAFEIGEWYKSDEHPELATKDGKFKLDKGKKGESTVNAAYNPYWHSTSSPLNDQFSTAYKRPELRTVEVEIPIDDIESGYHAENAKNSVGEHDWKGGPLSNQLKKYGIPQRKLMLSTKRRIVRVLDTKEIADRIEEFLGGRKVKIPVQCMTPELRAEMMRRGFRIGPPKGINPDQIRELKRHISDETLEKLYSGEIVDNEGMPIQDPDIRYARRADAKPFDERTSDGRKYNEKYADVRVRDAAVSRHAVDTLGEGGRELDAALAARRADAGEEPRHGLQ